MQEARKKSKRKNARGKKVGYKYATEKKVKKRNESWWSTKSTR